MSVALTVQPVPEALGRSLMTVSAYSSSGFVVVSSSPPESNASPSAQVAVDVAGAPFPEIAATGPVTTTDETDPAGPWMPWGPCSPVSPWTPWTPWVPCSPCGPAPPVGLRGRPDCSVCPSPRHVLRSVERDRCRVQIGVSDGPEHTVRFAVAREDGVHRRGQPTHFGATAAGSPGGRCTCDWPASLAG